MVKGRKADSVTTEFFHSKDVLIEKELTLMVPQEWPKRRSTVA